MSATEPRLRVGKRDERDEISQVFDRAWTDLSRLGVTTPQLLRALHYAKRLARGEAR